jgi:cytochrome c-type biogenesis protein CcmH
MTFWIITTVLLAGTILYVAASARRLRTTPDESAQAIYARRSQEMARDLEHGTLDAAQADAVAQELARSALHELPAAAPGPLSTRARRTAFVTLCALLPAIALPLYFKIGSPEMLNPTAPGAAPHERMSMAQMVEQLQQRIDQKPDDPEARMWMARVMMATEQYGQAVDQYAAVLKITGDRADVLVQYADALAMMNGGRMAGRPLELVERALAAEPGHITALWLAGLAAQEANDLPKAREYLLRARAASVEAHQPTDELDQQLAALDGKPVGADTMPAVAAGDAAPATPPAAVDGPSLEVKVALDPALASRIGKDAMLFVLARNPAGMPMPLAVQRLPPSGFPLKVRLDDSMAMSPAAKLSSASEVEVIARISQAGQAMAATGDLEGRAGPVPIDGAREVEIRIDRVLP